MLVKLRQKLKQKLENILVEILNKFHGSSISIINNIPQSAKINDSKLVGDISIGERSMIYKCELIGNIIIGRNTSINGPNTDIHSKINYVRIGNFCSIARNVSIQEYNHLFKTTTSYFIKSHIFGEDWARDINSKGNIEIGNDVWIGAQCIILSGAKIGDGAIIAANSVVTTEIPAFSIAAGSPAKVVSYRFTQEIIDRLKELQWWNWTIEKIRKNYDLFNGELTIGKIKKIID